MLIAVARSRATLTVTVPHLTAPGEVGLNAATWSHDGFRAVYVSDVRATVAKKIAYLIAVAAQKPPGARTARPGGTATGEIPGCAGIVIRGRLGYGFGGSTGKDTNNPFFSGSVKPVQAFYEELPERCGKVKETATKKQAQSRSCLHILAERTL